MPRDSVRAAAAGAGAVCAAAGFAFLNAAVARRRTAEADRKLLNRASADDDRLREKAEAISPAGKWYAYVPASLVLAAFVAARSRSSARRRAAAAGAILLSGITSAAVNPLFDRWLPQPPVVPPGRESNPKPVFPSGHTFGVGSVAAAAAYVLLRERLAPAAFVVPAAVIAPAVSGGAKILEEKHWPSDVAGGALVALAIAGMWTAAWELVD